MNLHARLRPLLLVALCMSLVTTVAAGAAEGDAERLFLRRSACADASDILYLSVTAGTELSCGNTATITPLNEVVHQVDGEGLPDTYATDELVEFVLDASRPITGQLTVSSYKGASQNPLGIGAGQAAVDIRLEGESTTDYVEFGRTTAEYLVTPDQDEYTVEFTFTPNPAYDGQTFTSFTLTTIQRGAQAGHGFQVYEGQSYFDVPVLPDVVEEPVVEEPATEEPVTG